MNDLINDSKSILKIVSSKLFLEYLMLDSNYAYNYKFSEFLNFFKIINKDKSIKKFNNFRNNNDFLDLVCNVYSDYTNVKLYYNKQNLLACFKYGEIYYNILINISHKNFKEYKNMINFANDVNEFIGNVENNIF